MTFGPLSDRNPPPPATSSPAGPSWLTSLTGFLAARRKFIVSALTPLLIPAAHYLGGVPIPHLWYLVVLGEAGALGVHAVPNTAG